MSGGVTGQTGDAGRSADERARTRMGAAIPPPPAPATGPNRGTPEKIAAASSTQLFADGFVTPAPKIRAEGGLVRTPPPRSQSNISDSQPLSPPRVDSDTGRRGPKRKEMSVTRPAWISDALDGRGAEAATKTSLGPGSIVPGTRYRITRWLGDGGMGVVYEAEHVDLGRKAALKVLRVELCRNAEALRMFREEARAASKLGDESIVDVFDFAELPDGRLLFAMELLDGRSLAQEIEAAPLEPSRAIAILRQICRGLAVAHDAGIIHRDVKPDNISLVTRRGRADAVKILDFGIATIVGEHTGGPVSAGSPYYLAPELVSGLSFDLRVDVYALGCTAYEMLTGVPPLRGDTVEDVLRAHLGETPQAPSVRAPATPPALDRVILKCLAKSAGARYGDMRELEAALCEAQIDARLETSWDDLPVPDINDPERRAWILRQMPDPAASMIMSRPKNRWALAAAGLALVLGGTALALSLSRQPPETAVEDTEVVQLVRKARAEAALHYYVYPPAETPGRATAYTVIRELEGLGSDGKTRAAELRSEFANTLVRLGGQYWDKEGGKPFAIDYYAQALVFDPESPLARERGTMTPGQLASLEDKAATGKFTANELAAVEPLVALAQDNPDDVHAGLEKLAGRQDSLAASTEASLERLVGKKFDRPVAVAPKVAPPPEPKPEDAAEQAPGNTPGGSTKNDSAGAQVLLAEAEAALKAGDRGRAGKLFEQALTRDRRNAAALIGLSDLNFSKGDYPKAVRFAERATKSSPKDAGYQLKLGDAYYKVLRYEDSKVAYDRARTLGSERAQARLERVAKKLDG